MRNLLLLLSIIPVLAYADSLDMRTLQCRSIKLNSSTTLADVQNNCMIQKQKTSKGRYQVDFINNETNKTVTCYFASNMPTALLNSCH
ncbi:MAG: hypothetical protein K2X04_05680 [Burkholderiales bacterium]|jgi:hypothetical protein|nr:hypothetical protein [Burkholderiales bacterium]